MKLPIHEMILKYLESKETEVIEEEGQMAAPATDTAAVQDALPVPVITKIAKRKKLEDE